MIITIKALAEQIDDSVHIEIWEHGWYHFIGTGIQFKHFAEHPVYAGKLVQYFAPGCFEIVKC